MPAGANDVELIFNDLSIHQQLHDASLFRQAINRLMEMRGIALTSGRELYCHRGTSNLLVNPTTSLFQEIQNFPLEQKRVILSWLTRQGPFWEDTLEHDFNEVFECRDDIVTDTGLGETAYRNVLGTDCRLISLTPSQWDYSPIIVKWLTTTTTDIQVHNHWEPQALKGALLHAEAPVESWAQLESQSRQRFDRLTFLDGSFQDLNGRPFNYGVAERIRERLNTLNRLMGEMDNQGRMTAEGQHLYQNYFVGERAKFSDSSDTEKNQFRQKLTFRDPDGNSLFCTWHGKVNRPPFRIHFSWPVPTGGQLYVVYVGWKITVH